MFHRFAIVSFLALMAVVRCQQQDPKWIEIRMPGVEPTKVYDGQRPTLIIFIINPTRIAQDDDYLCTFLELDPQEAYVTKFRVEGTAERAHHMILSGCPEVRSSYGQSWYKHFVIRLVVRKK